jgi:hypothetical protein
MREGRFLEEQIIKDRQFLAGPSPVVKTALTPSNSRCRSDWH